MKILVIFTCHNRKEKTENCIRTLVGGNRDCQFTFVAVDDNSADGTPQMLETLHEKEGYDIHLLRGNGNLFYSGGMLMGMEYALEKFRTGKGAISTPDGSYEYLLMINDDVSFYNGCVKKMIGQSREQGGAVIVGAMCDCAGRISYGAIKYIKGIKYQTLGIKEWEVSADTFCANCVLIPYEAFRKTGIMDGHYVHSLGDFDYGLSLKRAGYPIHISKEYAGVCEDNPRTGGWRDTTLSRKERIRQKESIKGAPTKQWFYFLKKNFGLLTAVKGCVTPYIRILLTK